MQHERSTYQLLFVLTTSLLVVGLALLGPRSGQWQFLTVLTGSMGDAMPAGSVVFETSKPPSEVVAGDVITFQIPGSTEVVTHRVVEIVEPGTEPVIRTKGDANDAPDPWPTQLTGERTWVVEASVPYVGTVLNWTNRVVFGRFGLSFIAGLLALMWLREIWSSDDDPAEVARV